MYTIRRLAFVLVLATFAASIAVPALATGLGASSLRLRSREVRANMAFTVAVDDFGWANSISGRAAISGKVTCAQSTTISIDWRITQTRNGVKHRASGFEQVACDGSTLWLDFSDGDAIKGGRAAIDLEASVSDPSIDSVFVSRTVIVRACTQIGTLGRDVTSGGPGNDEICSLAGNDLITGNGGNDTLRVWLGDDVASGGPGADKLKGAFGRGHLNGGRGRDRLLGDEGGDALRGKSGRDVLRGGPGRDVLRGGAGFDTCYGGPGLDVFRSCEEKHQ
jgi:Ca2+-binding RTX toxin-like protein